MAYEQGYEIGSIGELPHLDPAATEGSSYGYHDAPPGDEAPMRTTASFVVGQGEGAWWAGFQDGYHGTGDPRRRDRDERYATGFASGRNRLGFDTAAAQGSASRSQLSDDDFRRGWEEGQR